MALSRPDWSEGQAAGKAQPRRHSTSTTQHSASERSCRPSPAGQTRRGRCTAGPPHRHVHPHSPGQIRIRVPAEARASYLFLLHCVAKVIG